MKEIKHGLGWLFKRAAAKEEEMRESWGLREELETAGSPLTFWMLNFRALLFLEWEKDLKNDLKNGRVRVIPIETLETTFIPEITSIYISYHAYIETFRESPFAQAFILLAEKADVSRKSHQGVFDILKKRGKELKYSPLDKETLLRDFEAINKAKQRAQEMSGGYLVDPQELNHGPWEIKSIRT